MECRPYGDRGVLLSALSDAERTGLLSELEQTLPQGCSEFVLGYDSILLVGGELSGIRKWLKGRSLQSRKRAHPQRSLTVPVRYDGADLETVAETCGMSVDEVIQRHSAPVYTVRMMGFSPGFPYLDGLDPKLHTDRRQSPRNHIAPGSVAIGGAHAGIYSVASPGGWHLLGQTDLRLFDLDAAQSPHPDADSIFALRVGDHVRFKPVAAV